MMPDPEEPDDWEQAFENALPADDGGAPDPEAEVEVEATPDTEADAVDQGDTTAPEHWPAEDRAFLDSLPDDAARDRVLEWRKSIERGAQEKFEAAAEARHALGKIAEVVDDETAEELRAAGLSLDQGVGRLIQAHRALTANPAQALAALAQMYGVSLPTGNGHDPQRMAQIEQRERALAGHMDGAISTEVATFAKQPGREHFNRPDVRRHMAALITGGQAHDLAEAYEAAVWANPDLRQKLLAAQQAASIKGTSAKRQQEMDRAKAALTPRSRSVQAHPTAPTEAPSIIKALNDAWDEGAKR